MNYKDYIVKTTLEALEKDLHYKDFLEKYNSNSFKSDVDRRLFEALNSVEKSPFIYKYFGIEFGKKNLIDSTLYLSNPLSFNDIKDCNVNLITIGETYLQKLFDQELKNYSLYDRNKLRAGYKTKEFRRKFEADVIEKLNKDLIPEIGISCFTYSNNNELMWSHYAQKHEGVCIEYSFSGLIVFFSKLRKGNAFLKVSYSNSLSKIVIPDENLINSKMAEWISLKESHWSYEEELRLFNYPIKNRVIKIPEAVITAVYLGSKIKESHQIEIIKHVKENIPFAKIYKMQLNEEFKLIPYEVII